LVEPCLKGALLRTDGTRGYPARQPIIALPDRKTGADVDH